MPRVSEKKRLCDDLLALYLQSRNHSRDSEVTFQPVYQDPDFLFRLYLAVMESRYFLVRNTIPKALEWSDTVLPTLSKNRYRVFTRMTRSNFQYILGVVLNAVNC